MPERFIFEDFYPEVVEEILDQQKQITKLSATEPELQLDPRCFIVLDDCTDTRTHYSQTLDRLFFYGRHYNIWIFITAQYLKTLHPGK